LAITHARVRGCRYQDWTAIGELTELVSLEVLDWLAADLEPLRALTKLEQLHLHHLPHVASLDPLADLVCLRRLVLETIPGWDSSGKVTEVASLAPLRHLPLEEVNLFGVRPESRSVDDLLAIPTLRVARLSKYPAAEIRRINALVRDDWVAWQDPPWGSEVAMSHAPHGTSYPGGISFREP
jgi:hypothetical protein